MRKFKERSLRLNNQRLVKFSHRFNRLITLGHKKGVLIGQTLGWWLMMGLAARRRGGDFVGIGGRGIGGRGIGFAFPWLFAAGALAKFKL